jgi:Tol biopolymer transport system component
MKSIALRVLCASICVASLARASDDPVGVIAKNPAPDPTGKQVVFGADFTENANLWICGIDGSNLRQLTRTGGTDEEPAWSATGLIAFASTPSGAAVSDLWSIRPDGSQARKLTANTLNNRQPAWSPDGARIAFVSDRAGTHDIWVMNADGTAQQRVTTLPGEEDHPSFSPSGQEIVFSETVGESATLMIVQLSDGAIRPLTTETARDWNPSWSSAGIVFSSNRNASRWRIWRVQPDGSGLAPVGDNIGLDPVRLPDGRILFTNTGGVSAALAVITVLDPATGAKQVVSNVQGYLTGIDIRPRMNRNHINPSSRALVPVAMLSKSGFDAFASVDRGTLSFGRSGDEKSLASCIDRGIDVNDDQLADLICLFSTPKAGFRIGDRVGILRFRRSDGNPIEGQDAIVTSQSDESGDLFDRLGLPL